MTEGDRKILLVEDDLKIASFIQQGLERAGYTLHHAASGTEGLKLAETGAYEAAIIDLMLPGMDGLTLIEKLRAAKNDTPFLILSAKRSVDDRIKGLQAGGDDYLVKPFAMSELLARVQALIRRSRRTAEPTRLTVGDLTIDLISREVSRGNRPIQLQGREFSLLEHFMRNPDQVISKNMLLRQIWNYNFDPQTNVVDVLVFRLRNKIDKEFDKKMIHTIRGVGYVLKSS